MPLKTARTAPGRAVWYPTRYPTALKRGWTRPLVPTLRTLASTFEQVARALERDNPEAVFDAWVLRSREGRSEPRPPHPAKAPVLSYRAGCSSSSAGRARSATVLASTRVGEGGAFGEMRGATRLARGRRLWREERVRVARPRRPVPHGRGTQSESQGWRGARSAARIRFSARTPSPGCRGRGMTRPPLAGSWRQSRSGSALERASAMLPRASPRKPRPRGPRDLTRAYIGAIAASLAHACAVSSPN